MIQHFKLKSLRYISYLAVIAIATAKQHGVIAECAHIADFICINIRFLIGRLNKKSKAN